MEFSHKQKETIIIIVAWILVYASTPLYNYYALLSIQEEFNWHELGSIWCYNTLFLVLFLLNHYVLIPKFIDKKSIWAYLGSTVIALAAFITILVLNEPKFHHGMKPHHHEMSDRRGREDRMERGERMDRPERMDMPEGPEFMDDNIREQIRRQSRSLPLTPPDMARVIIAILMLGADFGFAAWLNSQKMRQRLIMLEQQNLKQELEHLRYQINPHFFMNTLNNIHALVDIDQERAKRAIIELSGLMRYTLYEGNGSMVALSQEVNFLKLYISLMKLRYSDKLEIVCDMPENAPSNIMIPPMLLATFVENAFKHGVSYLQHSYIHVNLSIDEENQKIYFKCKNSSHANSSITQDGHHGIGLENVRKRLDLQYTDNYTLTIDEKKDLEFTVELILPSNIA